MADETLAARYGALRKQYADFGGDLGFSSDQDYVQAGLIWGEVDGNETPRILLIALEPGHWDTSEPARLDDLAIGLLAALPGDAWPVFCHLKDDSHERCYELFGASGTQSVDAIPGIGLIREHERLRKDQTFTWSMKIYTRLMHRLDAFHEQVYQNVKDRVSDKNDIIEEVAKLLFLESFRCHHGEGLSFDYQGQQLNFREVFSLAYVKAHGALAVEQIQAAFDALKSHPDYVITADAGTQSPIFDPKTHLRLTQPRNYETLLEAIQDLGPVTDNQGRPLPGKDQGTLADVSGDVLGRVFDVFLRANFESKGGLGVYLTPNPVKQAMLDIAFHDIALDTKSIEELTAGNFRFCDPTCGSFGFGSVALSRLRQLIWVQLAAIPDAEKEPLYRDIIEHGFVGADSAPRMVMLARVNMALQGAPKAKIFYTDNSLTSRALKPNSFSLICTNPPFGTPKFGSDAKGQGSKKQYESNMEQILGGFRPAEQVVQSYNAWYNWAVKAWVDTGDLYKDEHGEPIWPGFRTDLRKVSGGKKPRYELHPSTGGLARGSKPDRKDNWQQVKGGSIDPAVLFIDRCLQLLKPGGRLLIVLPDGVLCNSGDRYVREYIMGRKDEQTGEFVGGKAIVKAVISLPSDTFKLSGTGAKTSILYLQKRHASADDHNRFLPEPQTDVFMAVADTLGYVVKNNIEDYSAGVPNDLDKIVGAYRRGE
ncbi:N-6 DNA methylase [uncultured Lamprocystis sp.]|jgi:type I restriction enzyme M protein|uniref:HsdM family class I SAM-dependent methyltransferase n=1 Tax=uncultured Lamprocystis sp. TaxID=543132 RepID=UPI0025CEF4C7|nr:N-6 DNA methylase [uncultured Lamprocystis sp.]